MKMEQRERQSNPFDAHFRCTRDVDGWNFEVGTVEWPHPSQAVTVWKSFRKWKKEPGSKMLILARAAAERRFCSRCEFCGELRLNGHMLDRKTCHGCASEHLGVCF